MDENNDLRPELTKKQKAQEAGKDVAEVAAKAAGNYFGGPIGGKAVDLALKTKAGQKLVNNAGKNLSKASPVTKKALENERIQNAIHKAKPMANQIAGSLSGGAGAAASGASNAASTANAASSSTSSGSGIGETFGNMMGGKNKKGLFKSLFSGNSTAQAELNDETPGEFSAGADVLKLLKKLFVPALAGLGSFGGCGFFLVIVVITAMIISPLLHVFDFIEGTQKFGEKIKNFVLLNGWYTDDEAAQKAMEDFYEEIKDVHNDYLRYGVELHDELLTATLTWYSPVTNEAIPDDPLNPTKMYDFKKSKKKVRVLANEMVTCYIIGTDIEVDCSFREKTSVEEFLAAISLPNYISAELEDALRAITNGIFLDMEIDLEKYRNYLEQTFIRQFYFNNEQSAKIDAQIPRIVDDIFSREAYFNYLNGTNTTNKKVYANCDNGVLVNNNGTIRNVSLDEYVAGVVCPGGNCSGMSEDEIKVQAIAVRTQVLNQTSNCTSEVVNDSFSANTNENILNIIKQTNNQIIISNDKIYDIDSIDKDKIKELLDKGLTYEEIIKELFGDEDATLSGMITINGQYVSASTAAMNVADLKTKADYYASIGEVELAGEFINLSKLYSSGSGLISQCPWYAKSRALELIYSSDMPDAEKLKAYKVISNSNGNGTNWYDDIPALNNFEKSSNINEPRVGAIISWSSDALKAGHSYGHVAIIEQVDYEKGTVTISESYNAGGVDASNTWNNVAYRLREFTFEQLESYGNYKNGAYSFNGYVYILG